MATGSVFRWLMCGALVALAACSRHDAEPTPAPSLRAAVTLRGIVRDAQPPGTGAAVTGAQLQVLYKTSMGPSAVSAADGSYTISPLPSGESFELRVVKEGYQSFTRAFEPLAGDIAVDVALTPIAASVVGR